MPTLILPPRYTSDAIALWKAAISAGWDVERLQGWRVPEGLGNDDVVLYGEPLFAAVVAEALAIALLEPPFDWLTNLPFIYRQRQVLYSTLAEARQREGPVFIKPADDKSFAAQVYESGAQLPSPRFLPDDTPVLIAEPVDWEVEFRCFVVQRKVNTLSPYWRESCLAQAEDGSWPASEDEMSAALEFASAVLNDNDVQFPPSVALDVGKITDRGWAVVEVNAAWGSGIYGCDPLRILPVLQRACLKQTDVTEVDERWIIERKLQP